MLIPLGTDRALKRKAVVTPALVYATIAAYVAMQVCELLAPNLANAILEKTWIIGGDDFRWWQPVTATLLHGGLLHLGGNMLFLWVFGKAVEDRYGRLGFLGLYIAGAYLAGFAHIWTSAVTIESVLPGFDGSLNEVLDQVFSEEEISRMAEAEGVPPEQIVEFAEQTRREMQAEAASVFHIPAVGASGAIAAVTGSFLVLFPKTWIRSLYLLGLRVVPVPAWFIIGLAIAFDLLSQSMGIDNGVANAAHLGGYAMGAGLSMVLLWLKVFPREPYDLFTAFRQANKRRQIRSAATAQSARVRVDRARTMAEEARSDAVASARARVSAAVGSGEMAEAVRAYRELLAAHGQHEGAATLSRNVQHAVVVQLVQEGDDEIAVAALGRFVDAYPHDPEADGFRVLLGRILARLGRDEAARSVLRWMLLHGSDESMKALAQEELDGLA